MNAVMTTQQLIELYALPVLDAFRSREYANGTLEMIYKGLQNSSTSVPDAVMFMRLGEVLIQTAALSGDMTWALADEVVAMLEGVRALLSAAG